MEAFASTRVIALRDALLVPGSPEDGTDHRKEADGHSAEVRVLYADLISQVREELKQDNEPWWRHWRPARGRRTTAAG